jgi:three-Cys-motif partner protein
MPAGPTEPVWPMEPHTLAKHEILRRYLGAWFPIMSKWNARLIFFDGFAGPGIYQNGEIGSPLIALQVLIGHPLFPSFGKDTEYIFLFCESDEARFASLEGQLEAYKQSLGGKWPDNVKVQCTSDPFDETASVMLNYLENKGSLLAPTFAFIDPFGVSGLPMTLLARLVSSPKCELFINMIMNTAKRFATSGLIDRALEELYGTNEFLNAEGLTGRDRIMFLHDLYAKQLHDVAGMTYVQSFEMINMQGHTSYFLFYATRAVEGLRAMKAAMWQADPGGGYRFSDRLAGQDVLFSEEFLDVRPLRRELLAHFAGMEVDVTVVERYVLTDTPYRETHLRKPVLKPLEEEDIITVIRQPGRRQFPSGTRIRFP